jgi:hypothetical protein
MSSCRRRRSRIFRRGLGRVMSVRTVRIGLIMRFQRVGADGCAVAAARTVREAADRPQASRRKTVGRVGFCRMDGRCGRCGRLRPSGFWPRRLPGGRDVDDPRPRMAFAPEGHVDADLARAGKWIGGSSPRFGLSASACSICKRACSVAALVSAAAE